MAIEISLANLDEVSSVYDIVKAAFDAYRGVLQAPPGALSETMEEVERDVAEGRVVLARYGGKSAGTARYTLKPDSLYIGRVAVHPDFQRLGVGAALMQHMEHVARDLGRTRLTLGTRESLTGNIVFYERLGYRITSREPHSKSPEFIVHFVKELGPQT